MNRIRVVVFPLAALFAGCASVVSGTQQSVSVDAVSASGSQIVGANCKLQNGDGTWFITTPGSTVVDRAYSDLVVTCEKSGAASASATARSSTKAIVFGNILLGGVLGAGLDVINGAAYEYPTPITVKFSELAASDLGRSKRLSENASEEQPRSEGRLNEYTSASADALSEQGCTPVKPPSQFRKNDRGQYYETFCTDGRLFHTVCKDGSCRLRSSGD